MSILSRLTPRLPRTDWTDPDVQPDWADGELAAMKADLDDRDVLESVDFTPEQSALVDELRGPELVAFLDGLFDPLPESLVTVRITADPAPLLAALGKLATILPPWDALADPIDVTEPAALYEALACPAVHPDGLACERPRLDRFGQTHRSGHAAAPGVDLLDGRPVVTWRAKPVTG